MEVWIVQWESDMEVRAVFSSLEFAKQYVKKEIETTFKPEGAEEDYGITKEELLSYLDTDNWIIHVPDWYYISSYVVNEAL